MTSLIPSEEAGLAALAAPPDLAPAARHARLAALGRALLLLIGEDPDREGLRDTPRRWADWWLEFSDYGDPNAERTFDEVRSDQMVVVSGIRVWSLCEHHLLPFWCDLTLGYLPAGRILGLSKFGRIAHLHAHRLQVQERLVGDIAAHLCRATGSEDVAVLGEGEHLCMTMRGARTPHRMQCQVILGRFRRVASVRQEFFHLAGRGP